MSEDIVVPIFVSCILPIAIALIVARVRINSDNRRTQILMKAIEAGNDLNADKLAEALRKPRKSAREILNRRLLLGCMFTLVGLAFMAIGIPAWIEEGTFTTSEASDPMTIGLVAMGIGASFLIVYFATRKDIKSDNE